MGPEGAVNIIFRRELAEAEDPVAKKAELVQEYRDRFANPYVAASRGYIDDVIGAARDAFPVDQRAGGAAQQRDTNPPKMGIFRCRGTYAQRTPRTLHRCSLASYHLPCKGGKADRRSDRWGVGAGNLFAR